MLGFFNLIGWEGNMKKGFWILIVLLVLPNVALAVNVPPVPRFVSVIPLLVVGLILGILLFFIVIRKGRNQ